VIVDEKTPEIRNLLPDIEVEALDRCEVLLASVVRRVDEWSRSRAYPLARNIAREGRTL
jgi:hypothetical protein